MSNALYQTQGETTMVFLEYLLNSDDFTCAVNNLASDFRALHNLGKIHQLGVVVADVEKAALQLEAKGIGHFFIASGAPVFWREKGQESKVSGKMGLAYYHGIELELLQPLQGSDFYTRSLDKHGKMVVQHLGFLVKDVDASAKTYEKTGTPVWVRGRLKAWPTITDFAYMEPIEENGLIMEFISWKILGWWSVHPPAGLFQLIGRIEKWSGKRCITI
jgi:hypothetical protein